MTPRSIPEVNDQIIDFLEDDKDALRACSQVSHNFKARSWHHLVIGDYVRELKIGCGKKRYQAHSQPDVPQLDTTTIRCLLSKFRNLASDRLIVSGARWSVVDLLPRGTTQGAQSLPSGSFAYMPLPVALPVVGGAYGKGELCVLPAAPRSMARVDTQPEAVPSFLIVRILVMPLVGDTPSEVVGESDTLVLPSEVVFHVGDPAELNIVALPQLTGAMRGVEGATVRWTDPGSLADPNGECTRASSVWATLTRTCCCTASNVIQRLGLMSATCLTSLTLWTTFRPAGLTSALREWDANLALLQQIPPHHIQRIGVGVLVEGNSGHKDPLDHVRRLRWSDLPMILGRFMRLETVEVIVREEKENAGDEIWSVIREALYSVRSLEGDTRLQVVRKDPWL